MRHQGSGWRIRLHFAPLVGELGWIVRRQKLATLLLIGLASGRNKVSPLCFASQVMLKQCIGAFVCLRILISCFHNAENLVVARQRSDYVILYVACALET